MESIRYIKKLVVVNILFFMIFSAFAEVMEPINTKWRWRTGDVEEWALEDISTSSLWLNAEIPGYIEDTGKFWIRGTVQIPATLNKNDLYFETGALLGAADIYANGVLIGRHGSIEPKLRFSHVANSVCKIPSSILKSNKIEIAIRCSSGSKKVKFSQFYLVDGKRFQKTDVLQSFLNTTVYFMMAAICCFLGLYFLIQFVFDRKDKANLSLALTLITIAIYFLDIASDILFLPYLIQISLSRMCLVLSIGFLDLFLLQNFKKKDKIPQIIIYIVFAICAVGYIITSKDDTLHEQMFTISLIPIFAGIIYIFTIIIKAVKAHERNSLKLLIGISIGMLFSISDIVYEIIGQTPFAWLQGFSFFLVDITMFVVVSIDSIQNKRTISEYAKTTMTQKDRLNDIIVNASKLSTETMEIANSLNESISNFSQSANQSANEADEISKYIDKQNNSINSTTKALDKLLNSVQVVKSEIAEEANVVSNTINETTVMINDAKIVSSMVSKSSEIANTLGELASKSRADVASLVHLMELIKDSSAEILNVVQIVADFANRTNMLAMNASIEAAHSGVQGKGFSVIAHEIKNLATASNSQAEKIRDIVTSINDNIMQSFDLTLTVNKTLGDVEKKAGATSDKVNETSERMKRQYEIGQRISVATDTMSKSAVNVKNEADQQYLFSTEVSSNMERLSSAASDAGNAVESIIEKNKQLSMQADSLRTLSKRAKVAAEGLNQIISEKLD